MFTNLSKVTLFISAKAGDMNQTDVELESQLGTMKLLPPSIRIVGASTIYLY